MADEGSSSSLTATSAAAKGKAKAEKKRPSTEANPRLDPYKFTDQEDPNYLKNITEAVWQAGAGDSGLAEDRVFPRPPWATLVWGPVPLREDRGLVKKLVRPSLGPAKPEGEQTEEEVLRELHKAWSNNTAKVVGSKNLFRLKIGNFGPAQVVAYLGFPDHGTLAAFALTEGLQLFGTLWREWSSRVGENFAMSHHLLQRICDLVNQRPSDERFMVLVGEIDRSPSYRPLVLSEALDPSSLLLDTLDPSGEVCLVATTVLYAYRALRWMTKGPEFNPEVAAEDWAEYARESPANNVELELFDVDLADSLRFRSNKRPKEEPREGNWARDATINRFLGYTMEDWQRSITLLLYLSKFWNKPSAHYGRKYKQDFFRQYWAGPDNGAGPETGNTRRPKMNNRHRQERATSTERATTVSDHLSGAATVSDRLGYYKLLNVPPTASSAEITRAYKARFAEISRAYEKAFEAYTFLIHGDNRVLYNMGHIPRGYTPESHSRGSLEGTQSTRKRKRQGMTEILQEQEEDGMASGDDGEEEDSTSPQRR